MQREIERERGLQTCRERERLTDMQGVIVPKRHPDIHDGPVKKHSSEANTIYRCREILQKIHKIKN